MKIKGTLVPIAKSNRIGGVSVIASKDNPGASVGIQTAQGENPITKQLDPVTWFLQPTREYSLIEAETQIGKYE